LRRFHRKGAKGKYRERKGFQSFLGDLGFFLGAFAMKNPLRICVRRPKG